MFHGRSAVHHTRIRLGLSALNSQRFQFGFIDNALCLKCNSESETVQHFFFHCEAYAAQREVLFNGIDRIIGRDHYFINRTNLSKLQTLKCVHFLLNGDNTLPFHDNVAVFRLVHIYINDSKRFL